MRFQAPQKSWETSFTPFLEYGVKQDFQLPVIFKALTCRMPERRTLLLSSVYTLCLQFFVFCFWFEQNDRSVVWCSLIVIKMFFDFFFFLNGVIIKLTVWTVLMCILGVATFVCAVQRFKSIKATFREVKQPCSSIYTRVDSADARRCRAIRGPSLRPRRRISCICRLVHWNDRFEWQFS